jgi:hypothetical protein
LLEAMVRSTRGAAKRNYDDHTIRKLLADRSVKISTHTDKVGHSDTSMEGRGGLGQIFAFRGSGFRGQSRDRK